MAKAKRDHSESPLSPLIAASSYSGSPPGQAPGRAVPPPCSGPLSCETAALAEVRIHTSDKGEFSDIRPSDTSTEIVGLVPVTSSQQAPALLVQLTERAREYAANAKAANTRRAYQHDWRVFETWCLEHGLCSLPATPAIVLAYLTAHAGNLKISTLQRHLTAIREAHRYAGCELDTSDVSFRDVWKGIRNTHGTPVNQKAALITATLRRALAALPDNLLGYRDRALLLIGFAAALRRSELASLEVAQRDGASGWIEESVEGLIIHIARSKTDRRAKGTQSASPMGHRLRHVPSERTRLGCRNPASLQGQHSVG
jgi:Phage integrase, N-terminal SAM-like domain